MNVDHDINAAGKSCPMPLLLVKKKLTKMAKGEVVKITVGSPGAHDSVKGFAEKSHEVLQVKDLGGNEFEIYIRK